MNLSNTNFGTHAFCLAILLAVVCACSFNMSKGLEFRSMKVKNPEIISAFESAKKLNKPVLIIFEAEWCPYCNRLNKETLKDDGVVKVIKQYEFLQVDVDENSDDAGKFLSGPVSDGGDGIPAIIIFSPNGKEVYRTVGFHDADEFRKLLLSNL